MEQLLHMVEFGARRSVMGFCLLMAFNQAPHQIMVFVNAGHMTCFAKPGATKIRPLVPIEPLVKLAGGMCGAPKAKHVLIRCSLFVSAQGFREVPT